jgi:hypothetical protein
LGAGGALRQPISALRERWRTNPFGVATAALAFIFIAAVLTAWLRDPLHASEQGSGQDAEFRLSHQAITLNGTRERLIVLERWNKDNSGASVNLLIVNTNDATSRWMFPDNGQTILTRDELYAGDSDVSPVAGLVLMVSKSDDEGKARQSLYHYRIGGGPAARFLTADGIVTAQQVGYDRYLVIYRNGGRTAAETFSLLDFSSLAQQPLPDIPQ